MVADFDEAQQREQKQQQKRQKKQQKQNVIHQAMVRKNQPQQLLQSSEIPSGLPGIAVGIYMISSWVGHAIMGLFRSSPPPQNPNQQLQANPQNSIQVQQGHGQEQLNNLQNVVQGQVSQNQQPQQWQGCPGNLIQGQQPQNPNNQGPQQPQGRPGPS